MSEAAAAPSPRVLLGVCGGIAAYKAAALVSTLVQEGKRLDVILTDAAQRFIAPLTFAALSQRPVFTSLWDAPDRIPHIRLVRDADVLAIVPASANVIAKLAHGIADDLLTNCALAARIPIVIAPAMNGAMYEHPATRDNLRLLRARGIAIVEPEVGFLAEREHGVGRLASEEKIVAAIDAACRRAAELAGQRVVITAGPTREPIDPVRFVSNASTGTTGIELAREALRRGAAVDLVLGPTMLEPPPGARLTRVTTAQEMLDATLPLAATADVVIASAAVADWRPAATHRQKMKKSEGTLTLEFVRTPDILQAVAERNAERTAAAARRPERRVGRDGAFVVGFAAETHDAEAYARGKLRAKRLDAIAVNDVSDSRGFGTGENELVLLWGEEGRLELGHAAKAELAVRFWDVLTSLRSGVLREGPPRS